MTFGGGGKFANVGKTDVQGARRQIDMCRDAGVNLIDTADVYSAGQSEEIVGEALEGRRDDFLLATKVRFAMGDDPNMEGLSRHHIIEGCEASLRRLRTDHIDLYQVHEWDGLTPLEETLSALEQLVDSGKVRYIGVSNYSGWQLMKALGVSERDRLPRFVSQQIYYSLQERSAEYELLPAGRRPGSRHTGLEPAGRRSAVGQVPPRPAAARRLAPRDRLERAAGLRRGQALRHDRGSGSRLQTATACPPPRSHWPGCSPDRAWPRSWSAPAPTSSWPTTSAPPSSRLTEEENRRLEEVSRPPLIYPYWHQRDRRRRASAQLIWRCRLHFWSRRRPVGRGGPATDRRPDDPDTHRAAPDRGPPGSRHPRRPKGSHRQRASAAPSRARRPRPGSPP